MTLCDALKSVSRCKQNRARPFIPRSGPEICAAGHKLGTFVEVGTFLGGNKVFVCPFQLALANINMEG